MNENRNCRRSGGSLRKRKKFLKKCKQVEDKKYTNARKRMRVFNSIPAKLHFRELQGRKSSTTKLNSQQWTKLVFHLINLG